MADNLTGTKVKDTYGKLVQVVGGRLLDGSGNVIDPNGIGLTYRHTQNSLSTTWVVNHNLGRIPAITITDSADSVLYADIHHNSPSQATITFSQSTSGNAWCS